MGTAFPQILKNWHSRNQPLGVCSQVVCMAPNKLFDLQFALWSTEMVGVEKQSDTFELLRAHKPLSSVFLAARPHPPTPGVSCWIPFKPNPHQGTQGTFKKRHTLLHEVPPPILAATFLLSLPHGLAIAGEAQLLPGPRAPAPAGGFFGLVFFWSGYPFSPWFKCK